MKKKPWERALNKFMPFCMILLAATTHNIWVGSIMFGLCYAQLWIQEERNKDEEDDKTKAMVDELIKIGERKP